MLQLVQSHMPHYSEINLRLAEASKNYLHKDKLRDTGLEFRAEVEFTLLWTYMQLGYDMDQVSPGEYRLVRKGGYESDIHQA